MMQHTDISPVRYTSVTIRKNVHSCLKKAVSMLAERGLQFSEQRLMRECLRLALHLWRGQRGKARRNKRYNRKLGSYEIVPFYTTEALRSVAWLRCHHSGMSLSRLMDFAIRHYLDRVVEGWLSVDYVGRAEEDIAVWKAKYEKRRPAPGFIISYDNLTHKNDRIVLMFEERMEFKPWPLPPTQFLI
jgi:hypothetical protein